jgi:hypothetical protein
MGLLIKTFEGQPFSLSATRLARVVQRLLHYCRKLRLFL